jgi:hypothetical protein
MPARQPGANRRAERTPAPGATSPDAGSRSVGYIGCKHPLRRAVPCVGVEYHSGLVSWLPW